MHSRSRSKRGHTCSGTETTTISRRPSDSFADLHDLTAAATRQPLANFLGLAHARQHPVELALDDAIAFARTDFQTCAIEHLDTTTAVMDQTGVMELSCRFRDPFATHAEHVRDHLLRHLKLVGR